MNDPKTASLSRRRVFAGAGTLGALAAAATVLPGVTKPDPAAAPGEPTAEPPQTGYRLTEHIERYYRTTRV
jgi:hypothetical protein